MDMPSGKGDLGTRASEKTLAKTSAGKGPTMSQAFNGMPPDLGKAKAHLCSDMKDRGTKNPMSE